MAWVGGSGGLMSATPGDEGFFSALAEALPSCVFVADENGRNLYANGYFQRYAGRNADALLRYGWRAVLHPDDHETTEAAWTAAQAVGALYDVRCRMRRFDGEHRWHAVRGSMVSRDEGQRWVCVCIDIDDMVRSIEAKSLGNAILAAFDSSTEVAIYGKDERDRFLHANAGALAVVGQPADRLIGRQLGDFASDREGVLIGANDEVARQSPGGCAFEEEWTTDEGVRHFRSVKAPFRLANGRMGVAGVSFDVTRHILEGQANSRDREGLLGLLATVPSACWRANDLGVLTSVSQSFHDYAGTTPAMTPALSDIVSRGSYPEFEAAWSYAVSAKELLDCEVPVYDHVEHREVRMRVVAWHASAIRGAGTSGWFGAFHPIRSNDTAVV